MNTGGTEGDNVLLPVQTTGGDLKPNGPMYVDVVREVPAPIVEPKYPSADASLCRIADVLEAGLQDARHYRHRGEVCAVDIANTLKVMLYVFGTGAVAAWLLLAFALFR